MAHTFSLHILGIVDRQKGFVSVYLRATQNNSPKMTSIKVSSALISVFDKTGLPVLLQALAKHNVTLYSTGGTMREIERLGYDVTAVESLTGYPSILDGRVKTLHPAVFGGILARREDAHLKQLNKYEIPTIDLVVVDLYPFEETVRTTSDESAIIEKIDIGGVSLLRAAAKNYKDVAVISSQKQYESVAQLLDAEGSLTLEQRRDLAVASFAMTRHYDSAIAGYFETQTGKTEGFAHHSTERTVLRYGENPHQEGAFYGNLDDVVKQISGKAMSYNNLVDIDAAVNLMADIDDSMPSFAILKHTNACGVARRSTVEDAYKAALAGDPISAFGGILISNTEIDLQAAEAMHDLFFEVLIAPSFAADALELLTKKKKRIILELRAAPSNKTMFKSLLGGVIVQDVDSKVDAASSLTVATKRAPSDQEQADLLFASICAKHLKSNTIALIRDNQLLGMGCGQTSRVDALKQAIVKAKAFGFDLQGSVMASDAFFPFSDCVEIAHEAGITAVIQPGGSIRDKDSIAFCDDNNMAMVMTGTRHFKH